MSAKFSNPQEKNTLENKPNINIKDAFKGSLYFTSNAKKEKIDKRVKELDNFISDVLAPLLNTKKKEKSISKIVLAVEKKYLKVFNASSQTIDLLEVQQYNCITQSLLYAYIFDQLQIPAKIEVYQKIKEWSKERIQRFKGVVIKTAGKSTLEKTITVRRKVGAFAVEKIFAIHSPTIEKIEVLRQFKVRRKSIKYIRNLTGKAARLKEIRK